MKCDFCEKETKDKNEYFDCYVCDDCLDRLQEIKEEVDLLDDEEKIKLFYDCMEKLLNLRKLSIH